MVNIKINTDFMEDKEINGKAMVIITAIDKSGESEIGVYGGEGVGSRDIMTGLIKSVIGSVAITMEDNPEEIRNYIRAAGKMLTDLAEKEWIGVKTDGKSEI